MERNKLKLLIDEWKETTHTVLDLKEIPFSKTQALLLETYRILTMFYKNDLVPKEISEIFLEMSDFLYFASLMEEVEVGSDYYHYRKIYAVVNALKDGFFRGEYVCDFPKLQVVDDNQNVYVIDLETDCFIEKIVAF